MKRKSGFTLVELLVVIGIIALLIAILLPSLNKARNLAVRTKCLAQIRQLGQMVFIYAANNKGRIPIGAMNLNGGGALLLNEEYITDEMYVNFGFKDIEDATGNWNGVALAPVWVCPATPTMVGVTGPVNQWNMEAGGYGYGKYVVSGKTGAITTSYVYCGVGIAVPYGTFGTATKTTPGVSGSSYVANYDSLATNFFSAGSNKVLFADKVYWELNNGFNANHGVITHPSGGFQNPSTPGLNEVYADGHGAWVDLSKIIPITPISGGSVPTYSYPPKIPPPANFPSVVHRTDTANEMWFW